MVAYYDDTICLCNMPMVASCGVYFSFTFRSDKYMNCELQIPILDNIYTEVSLKRPYKHSYLANNV